MQRVTSEQIDRFRQTVYEHFQEHGRDLPWRTTSDPYAILVSEFMLQQTQVERVLPKYEAFLEMFPDAGTLARAPLRDVLAAWQGLGYNRRAMALQRTAQRVVDEFGGRVPESYDALRTFPGIGPATAGEITAFAFGKPAVFIETNIRRVFIHFFFHDRTAVSDSEILPLVEATLDREQPRAWYYALMDYGVLLKTLEQNPNRRSKHYSRQARFEGSDRQIRGLILKTLVEKTSLSIAALVKAVGKERERTEKQIDRLVEEGFLCRKGNVLSIVSRADEP